MARTSDAIRKGRDTYGAFELVPGTCVSCRRYTVCVRYATTASFGFNGPGIGLGPQWEKIDVSKTILKKHRNTLGLLCGCYGTFHRQMAHIGDRRTARHTG